MYKTIRHGENSLQYTILPQNDDFRIEGKLSGNGSKGGSALRQAAKRGRKRSFFAYFGLLFVCTVIVGAILVPFLVSTEYLPTPSVWFLKRRIFMDGANYNNTATNESEHRENTSRSDSTIPLDDLPATTTHETRIATKLGSSVTDKNSIVTPTGLGRIYSNLAESFARVSTERAVTTHKWKDDDRLTAATASREVTTEKELVQITTPDSKESTTSSVNRNATSKRPIILPVLAKTNSVVKENGKWVKNRSEPEGWIRSHWPFIDPSTYFQWAVSMIFCDQFSFYYGFE
ncbi:unnamed protein product [Hermetia illucens]|uniref:Uncharacterized protein n=1 Tax=Hermetia illucens TaxID=343691 RepID=A0A7R8UTS1_HERIL|nr:unnamed protein product [Hermetia illucens]